MRRKLVNRVKRYNRQIGQYFKRLFIRMLYPNILINNKTFIGKGARLTALKGATIDIRGVYIKDYAHIYAGVNAYISIGQRLQ